MVVDQYSKKDCLEFNAQNYKYKVSPPIFCMKLNSLKFQVKLGYHLKLKTLIFNITSFIRTPSQTGYDIPAKEGVI